MDRKEFEDRWKKALEGAEIPPAGDIWSSMESKLIAAENIGMKQKVVFYQRLAAASVLFALALGAFGYYYGANTMAPSSSKPAIPADRLEIQPKTAYHADEKSDGLIRPEKTGITRIAFAPSNKVQRKGADFDKETSKANPNSWEFTTREMALVPVRTDLKVDESYRIARNVSVPPNDSLVTLAEEDAELMKLKDSTKVLTDYAVKQTGNGSGSWWVAMDYADGNYYPGSPGTAALGVTTTPVPAGRVGPVTSPVSTSSPIGSFYSISFLVGKQISGRWVIQTGVQYLNEQVGFSSNLLGAYGNSYLSNYYLMAPSSVTYTAPYDINSTSQYLSVPVQAGYILLKQRIGMQVNAGLATDFFLNNSLRDPGGSRSAFSQSAGKDSPYRGINWAGLVNAEFSYRLSGRYRFGVVPGARYLLSPAVKSGSTSHSYTTYIGFRMQYVIKAT
jgi:Outer membrane protein beta-barrel domain